MVRIHRLVAFMATSLLGNDGYPCRIMRRAVQYHNEEEMSIRNTRLGDTLKLAAAVIALLAVAAVALCVGCAGNGDSERQSQPSSSPSSESDLDRYFLRDAATVEAMGLPVYWLGRATWSSRGPTCLDSVPRLQVGASE